MIRSSLLAAAATMALGAAGAQAQDRQVELKFSLWVPPAHPLVQSAQQDLGPSIEKASNGTIKVTVFPSEIGRAHV